MEARDGASSALAALRVNCLLRLTVAIDRLKQGIVRGLAQVVL